MAGLEADVTTIPVLDVHCNNAVEVWPAIRLAIQTANFLSVDLVCIMCTILSISLLLFHMYHPLIFEYSFFNNALVVLDQVLLCAVLVCLIP